MDGTYIATDGNYGDAKGLLIIPTTVDIPDDFMEWTDSERWEFALENGFNA